MIYKNVLYLSKAAKIHFFKQNKITFYTPLSYTYAKHTRKYYRTKLKTFIKYPMWNVTNL